MTKAFVNVRASIAITKQLLKLPGIDRPDDIIKMLKYVDDPIKMSVCNLVRFFGKDMDTIDSMYSSFTHASKRHTRFMELAKTPGTVPLMGFVKGKANDVIMFPNIPINYFTAVDSCLTTIAPISDYAKHLTAFDTIYEAEIKDDVKKRRWMGENGSARGLATLKKHRKISLASLLSDETIFNFKALGYKDDFIRDLADHISSERAAYTLKMCKTIEELEFMYASGPASCMSYTADKKKTWLGVMEDHDPPSALYHYIPDCYGAVLVKNKTIHARCLVFREGNRDGVIRFSRVYSSNEVAKDTLERMLRDKGITPLNGGVVSFRATFSVPGRKCKNNPAIYYSPNPYIDHRSTKFYAKFDSKTKEFHFETFPNTDNSPEQKKLVADSSWVLLPDPGTSGYLLSSTLSIFTCKHCRTVYKAKDIVDINNAYIHFRTGEFACRTTCANELKWVRAQQGTGGRIIVVDKEEVVEDCLYPGEFFTNERAMTDHGGLPVITDPFAVDEEPGMSRHSDRYDFRSTKVRFDMSAIKSVAADAKEFKRVLTMTNNIMTEGRMTIRKVKEVDLDKPIVTSKLSSFDKGLMEERYSALINEEEAVGRQIISDTSDHAGRNVKLIKRVYSVDRA